MFPGEYPRPRQARCRGRRLRRELLVPAGSRLLRRSPRTRSRCCTYGRSASKSNSTSSGQLLIVLVWRWKNGPLADGDADLPRLVRVERDADQDPISRRRSTFPSREILGTDDRLHRRVSRRRRNTLRGIVAAQDSPRFMSGTEQRIHDTAGWLGLVLIVVAAADAQAQRAHSPAGGCCCRRSAPHSSSSPARNPCDQPLGAVDIAIDDLHRADQLPALPMALADTQLCAGCCTSRNRPTW